MSGISERIWGYGNVGNTLIVIVGLDIGNSASNDNSSQTNAFIADQSSAYPLEAGQFLDPQSNQTVVIGKGVAELLGASVGTELSILTEANVIKRYNVVGIFNSESSIYSADMILMNLNTARDFFNIPDGKVTDLLVYVNDVER